MPTNRVRHTFSRIEADGSITPAQEEVIVRENHQNKPKRSEKVKQKALDKTPKKLKNPSNLQVRLRTGTIYIVLTVVCVIASPATTALYLAVLSGICAGEFYFMLRSDAKLPNEMLGIIAAAAFPLCMWLFGILGIVAAMSIFLIVLLVWYVFWLHARITDVAISLFGASYTGLLMSSAMLIRMCLPDIWGGVLIIGIFASIWVCDGLAYLVGSKIGKHKMTPQVSPKKSWEGFFAGLISCMLVWCLFPLIPGVSIDIVQALFCGAVCGILGVIGDLVESRIKRNSGFKDSGTIMPGHGGLLDRCDSQFLVTVGASMMLIVWQCIPFVPSGIGILL